MKRWLSAALAALMILSSLSTVACANTGENAAGTTAAPNDTAAEETDLTPDVVKQDYEGKVFQMIGMGEPGDWYYAEEYIGQEGTVHVLNNTVFEMNTMVEDYLGVEIAYEHVDTVVTGGEIFDIVQPTIMAGDDAYQLCILHPYYSYNSFISQNYALDFYTLPDLDLQKPYWNAEVMDQLSINGHAYIGLGDLCRYTLDIIYCNKDLLRDVQREVPYDLVREMAWTFDAFAALTTGLYKDDGNGNHDNKDTYGFASLWDANASAFMQASDIYVLKRNEENTFELSMYGERLIDLYSKLYKFSKDDSTYLWNYGNSNNPDQNMDFHSQQMYFTLDELGTKYLDADFEVGMLPLPKYDVAQKEYAHPNWGNNIVLPTTITDKTMEGQVLEMMAYYSKTHVQQVYYDEVLQLRVSDAPDDREMVELIYNTVVFDPGIAYCDGYNALWNLVYLPTFAILNGQESIATYYKKNSKGANRALEELFKNGLDD